MIDARVKAKKDKLALVVVKNLPFARPLAYTFLGFIAGIISIISILSGYFLVGLFFWLANRAFDILDGAVARSQNKQTLRGGFLDMVFDLIIYAGVVLAFIWQAKDSIPLYIGVALFAVLYINIGTLFLTSSILEKMNRGRSKTAVVAFPGSFIEGAETVIIYSLWFIFPEHGEIIALGFLIAMIITIIHRTHWGIRVFGKYDNEEK